MISDVYVLFTYSFDAIVTMGITFEWLSRSTVIKPRSSARYEIVSDFPTALGQVYCGDNKGHPESHRFVQNTTRIPSEVY